MFDVQSHQAVVNKNGDTTSVLIPYEDYKAMIDVMNRYVFLENLEKSIHSSMAEIDKSKSTGKPLRSLKSLLDES